MSSNADTNPTRLTPKTKHDRPVHAKRCKDVKALTEAKFETESNMPKRSIPTTSKIASRHEYLCGAIDISELVESDASDSTPDHVIPAMNRNKPIPMGHWNETELSSLAVSDASETVFIWGYDFGDNARSRLKESETEKLNLERLMPMTANGETT